MRVLILSQYYKPEPIPKVHELAEELQKRGHDVTVITGVPNYPSGNLYPGSRLSLMRRETVDGVPVVRTFEFPYHGRSTFGRILNYVTFMLSAPLASFRTAPCDVIYVWHPPLTIGISAWVIGALKRAPFVYDVQDIWPESAVLSGMFKEGALVRTMRRLERFVYRRAARILAVTEQARQNLVDKGVAADRVSVMDNWVDESMFAPADAEAMSRVRETHGWSNRFVLMFAGNLGMVQGLDTVIEAVARLKEPSRFLVVLVGDGSDRARLQSLVQKRGLAGVVQFIDRQPQRDVARYLSAADALLVHLKKSELSDFVIPTKTLAYLSIGRPILVATSGAASELVERAGAGIAVPPEDPAALAEAMERLGTMTHAEREKMGDAGRAYVRTNLLRGHVIDGYESLLEAVASSH